MRCRCCDVIQKYSLLTTDDMCKKCYGAGEAKFVYTRDKEYQHSCGFTDYDIICEYSKDNDD